MEKAIVTFLISMYNTPMEQLKSAIESIINQSYKDYKILIINDGTKDESVKIIESYQNEKITIVHNPQNIGLEKSLNRGIEMINTKYIARMDTDDISHINRLEKEIKFAEEHPEYAVIATRVNLFDDNGIYGETKIDGEIKKEDLLFGTPFIHPTMLIKTSDLKEIGGYSLYHRCEDYAMIMELYCKQKKGYIMPEILLNYRMDQKGYQKRKLKDRLIEMKVKLVYFKKLKIPFHQYYYIIKPLIVMITPRKLIMKYHKNKFKKEVNK